MNTNGTRTTGALSLLLAAALVLVPAPAAHADGIRAQQWSLDAMHTAKAWQTTKGAGVTVAVLDTGVEADHPDLAGNVLTGKDLVGFGASEGDRAWARHGTAMAGIIAGHGHGPGNSEGVMGVAPDDPHSVFEADTLPVEPLPENRGPAGARNGLPVHLTSSKAARWAMISTSR